MANYILTLQCYFFEIKRTKFVFHYTKENIFQIWQFWYILIEIKFGNCIKLNLTKLWLGPVRITVPLALKPPPPVGNRFPLSTLLQTKYRKT